MIPRLQPWVLTGLLLLSASSVPSTSAITSFTTSGPEASLTSPKTLSAPTPTSNATTPKHKRTEDLAESQSSQSSSVVNAPVGHSASAFQQEQYRHFLQHSASHSAAKNPSTAASVTTTPRGALGDLSTTATQSHSQAMTPTGGSRQMTQQQQNMALMRARPGQFTLVSNQQVGPGHVTMLGYTTPIVKVGGIVKADQMSPGQTRHESSSAAHPGNQAASDSSAIYTSSATSSMYNSPGMSHHSQLINHAVPSPKSHQDQVSHDLRVGTHAAIAPESSHQSAARQESLSASPASYGSPQMYFEKQTFGQLPQGYSYGTPETGPRSIGHTYQLSPEQVTPVRSAKLQSSPMMSQGMAFSSPMEKPKPFLVYKPGYLEKLKNHQAAYPQAGPVMMQHQQQQSSLSQQYQPQYQQEFSSSPLSPISMAHLSQSKAQIEKHGLSSIMPIQDLESNDISGQMPAGQMIPSFESQRTHQYTGQTIPQIVQQGQPQASLSAHLAQARPISIAKQMTMDALAHQRSHIMSAQMRPEQLMMPQPQQQPQQAQYMQQPQMAYQQESPKMFGQPIESPFAAQFSAQQMHQAVPQYERSAKMRVIDQAASGYQIPQPQVTSSITMPEPNQRVDPKQELQDQINFVLQNSPNLSENIRTRHRSDIMKAVQESLSESDNSAGRSAVASPRQVQSQHQRAQQQQSQVASQGPSPFELGGGLTIDGLIPQSYSSRPESSAENPRSSQFAGSKLIMDTPYHTSSYKQSLSPSSQHVPESNYFSRYNQENTQFLPQDASPESRAMATATHAAAQSSAALNRDYKVKLQQEIQRYLSDQIDTAKAAANGGSPANFLAGTTGPMFAMSQNSAIQSPSHPSMLKYQSSPLRKMVNLVERQPSQQSMMLNADSQRSRESQSNANSPHHFVLARQTEFVQSQASQQSRTQVKAPESLTSSSSSSSSPSSSKSSAMSPYSALMSQLAQAASSAVQPESAKTLRGYSEWWKESAAVNRPLVQLTPLYVSQH